MPVPGPSNRECPKCRHDTSGVPAAQSLVLCPECGTTFDASAKRKPRLWKYCAWAVVPSWAVGALAFAAFGNKTLDAGLPVAFAAGGMGLICPFIAAALLHASGDRRGLLVAVFGLLGLLVNALGAAVWLLVAVALRVTH